MKKILIFACFVNGLLLCTNVIHYLIWLILLILYQVKTQFFQTKHFLLCCVYFVLSQNTYVFVNHQVIETKEKYAIVSIDHQKVILYTDEPLFYGDHVEVKGKMEQIHSLSNFNLTNFEIKMKQKHITKMIQEKDTIIKPKASLQRKIYEYIETFEPETQKFLKRILYNYENNGSLIYSSGLHFSYFNQFIRKLFPTVLGNSLGIIFMIILGIIFPSHFAIQRIIIFNLLRIIFPKMNNKDRLGMNMLVCMFINSSCVFELGYIIPVMMQFINCFNCRKLNQRILSCGCLIFMNYYFFGEVNLFEIFFFSLFQKLHMLMFFVAIMILCIPILGLFSKLFAYIDDVSLSFFTLYGKPSFLVTLIFVGFGIVYLSYGKRKDGFICFGILCYIPLQAYFNPFYEVTFLNVGQGDCILLQAPFNQYNIMIDIPSTKNQNIAEKIVVPYLKSIGVHHLDTLILTHDDLDHAGGEKQLKELITVNQTITSHEDVDFYKIKLQSLNTKHEEENANSLVYYLNIHGLTYLFMGDALKSNEVEMIESYPTIQADILKVGHHGSKTSTDPLFLQQLRCKMAIISAGYQNFYGHPHEETLQTLEKYQVKSMITFNQGACKIKSFLNFHFLITSSGYFGIII